MVEHEQLIHEFERLTSDPDGLLGVLEETLSDEYGDEANFEAKRLLCALFQVQLQPTSVDVIHKIYLPPAKVATRFYCRNLMIAARKQSSMQCVHSLSHSLQYSQQRQKKWRMPVEVLVCYFMHLVYEQKK